MSYKDMTTRRQIAKEHMEVFLSIEQGHLLHKQYLDKKASFQNSTTYEKDKARRLLLQELDKENNKTNPNNKKEKLKVVQTRFGKNKGNIKSSHKKQNRKVRRIRRKL